MSQVRLVLPDLHVPYEDKHCTQRWLQHAAELRPDGVDIIGDLIDAYSLSRFDKNPGRKENLQDELDQAKQFLGLLRKTVGPKCDIRYSEGNHEQRLTRLLWSNCRALSGLRNLSMPDLLGLSDLGIRWYPMGAPYRIGSLTFMHGDTIRKHGGATARTTSDKVGGSVILGHCHRMGWCPTTSWMGTRDAYEVGHLADYRQLEYVSGVPQWQQGWAVATIGKGWHDIQFVRVIRKPGRHGTKFIYKGEEL